MQIEGLWQIAFGVAYRILGLPWQAEDVAQDAVEALLSRPQSSIERVEAYIAGIAAHLALSRIRSDARMARRHAAFGLPAPLDGGSTDAVETRIDLSYAITAIGLQLPPFMRAVFVLRSAFDLPYAEIAAFLNCTEDAARQTQSRARRRMKNATLPTELPPADQQTLARLATLVAEGDPTAVARLLADEIELYSDGGTQAPAFGKILTGRDRIAGFLVVSPQLLGEALQPEFCQTASGPFFGLHVGNKRVLVAAAQISGGRIGRLFALSDPGKLAGPPPQSAERGSEF